MTEKEQPEEDSESSEDDSDSSEDEEEKKQTTPPKKTTQSVKSTPAKPFGPSKTTPNETGDVLDDNDTTLGKFVTSCERQLNKIQPDLDKLEKMRNGYKQIVAENLFGKSELREYLNMVDFNTQTVTKKLGFLLEDLNKSKMLWAHKTEIMKSLYEQGILDDGVVATWKSTMKTFESRIEDVEKKIDFLK